MAQSAEDLRIQRQRDGLQTAARMERVVAIGEKVIANSNLVRDGQTINSHDIQVSRALLETTAPIDASNYRYYQHIELTPRFGRKFAAHLRKTNPPEFGHINPDEIEVACLLHDFGKPTTPRFQRSDAIGNIELREMGVRQDMLSKLPSLNGLFGKNPEDENKIQEEVDQMSAEQKIILMADICGKRNVEGGIKTFDEVIKYHTESRTNYVGLTGIPEIWPSEKRKDRQFVKFSEKVYRRLKEWFTAQGIDIEKTREQILREEETTPIRAIVFDVGNVLVLNPEADVIPDIANRFAIESEIAEAAWAATLPPYQTGEITDEEFWNKLSENIGKPLPENYQTMAIDRLGTERDPALTPVLTQLKKQGYTLAVHSDTIPPHIKKFDEAGVYEGFDVRIFSPEIKTTKRSPIAFTIAALKLWLPVQALAFIDDKQEYIDAFHVAGGKLGIHHTSAENTIGRLQDIEKY